MRMLEERLMSPSILPLPLSKGQYIVNNDACHKQVGAVLLQKQPDEPPEPIGYCSRSVARAKQFYNTTERGCFTVVWALLHLRSDLQEKSISRPYRPLGPWMYSKPSRSDRKTRPMASTIIQRRIWSISETWSKTSSSRCTIQTREWRNQRKPS